jgi:D-glycero-alpha-D-manno-heptose-7-phosphate kinase
MAIQAETPCRVDLAGGTLDIWPLYLFHSNPVTVNFAVSCYTRCRIEPRADRKIVFRSKDLNLEESFGSLAELTAAQKPKLGLHTEITKFFAPASGFEMDTVSEAPAGAGISGSSALMISSTAAFNKWLGTGYSVEKIREVAQNVEARIIHVPTGCQDYYPAMYGGVNAIELRCDGLKRYEISVDHTDLISRVVLAYTGVPRNSGINNWEVTKAHINGDKRVQKNFDTIAAIANGMRAALEKADWKEAARLLREEWSHRRKNAPGITTPLIDHLVSATRKAGAVAAKVCGAGGGGCVLFLVEPGAKERVAALIAKEKARVLPVTVAPKGLRLRTV